MAKTSIAAAANTTRRSFARDAGASAIFFFAALVPSISLGTIFSFGAAHILGPTGGYLAGFIAASYLIGRLLGSGNLNVFRIITSFIMGSIILYACGVAWLILAYKVSPATAFAMGVMPFVLGEAIKISLAAAIYIRISNRAKEIF